MLLSCSLHRYMCVQMKKHGMLIVRLIVTLYLWTLWRYTNAVINYYYYYYFARRIK